MPFQREAWGWFSFCRASDPCFPSHTSGNAKAGGARPPARPLAPEQILKQMRRTGHRWAAGHGAGLGRREEHLEVMGVFAFKGLPASKLLLNALKNIPHDGRTIFPNKTLYSSGGAGCAVRTIHFR